MVQSLVVALVVVACALHAAWSLAPVAARRAVAGRLLALPLPRRLAATLRRHADATSAGCACDGCDKSAAKAKTTAAPPGGAPITFHPRLPR
jgi:hypothetical protein